jgi:predicted Rossmann fold nucleotide-binding protein DprA/Smf involved in DNA uptake
MAIDIEDIVETMGWTRNHPNNQNSSQGNQMQLFGNLNPIETQVMQWLMEGIQKPDEMLQQNQWSASHIAMALLDLEIKGLVTAQGGSLYTARC